MTKLNRKDLIYEYYTQLKGAFESGVVTFRDYRFIIIKIERLFTKSSKIGHYAWMLLLKDASCTHTEVDTLIHCLHAEYFKGEGKGEEWLRERE